MRVRYFEMLYAVLWAALILALVVLAWAVAWNRAFQVDEVQHVHVAYNIKSGWLPYVDFWEGHNLLLHVIAIPFVDVDNPSASFMRLRMLGFAISLLAAVFAGLCARRLSGPHAGLLCFALLLAHSTFVERGMEIRTDGGFMLGIAIALWLELTSTRSLLFRHGGAAIALSIAFLFTPKAAILVCVFGCLWLWRAVRKQRIAIVLYPCLIWLVPVLIASAAMAIAGIFDDYVRLVFGTSASRVVEQTGLRFGPTYYIFRESVHNLVFVVLGSSGAVAAIISAARGRVLTILRAILAVVAALLVLLSALSWQPTTFAFALGLAASACLPRTAASPFVGVAAAVGLASLWVNPFPFPYNHIPVIPLFAVVGTVWATSALQSFRIVRSRLCLRMGVLLVVSAQLVTSTPRVLSRAIDTNDYQLAVLEEVSRATEPQDRVWDMVGLYFRPDAYYWYSFTSVMMKIYRKGGYQPLIPMLRKREVVASILSYRSDWLNHEERRFVSEHFVSHGPILFLGSMIQLAPHQELEWEALKTKEFEWRGEGTLWVDGASFLRGQLSKGRHHLSAPEGARGRLILASVPAELPIRLRTNQPLYRAADF